jgi:phosphate transport system substrate-binding protein
MSSSRFRLPRLGRTPTPYLVTAFLAIALLLKAVVPAGAAAETVIRIGGTGGALGTMKLLGDAFAKSEPEFRVNVLPSLGSGGGIKAVLAGTLDLAVSVRPLSAEEKKRGARERIYARSPFVFVTSEKSSVSGVTTQQLIDIYSGKTISWPGGGQIRLVLRPEGDSDTVQLLSFSPAMARAVREAMGRKGMAFALSDQEAADVMEKAPGSLGTSILSLIRSERRSLRVLSLDGVVPTPKTLASGAYPHEKIFYAVTAGEGSPSARRFLAFLKSPEGRKVLAATGHLEER